ncbi:hypothetical protein LWI29_016165 [Acer saccharum]|uniref:Uncharacterized protein n=1 Tax=Acer saccharum TaxID=4024 RepID=A0AA39SE79_ACESA|nr:hypothetical protein LWI29_016165 [Acer saccharum]
MHLVQHSPHAECCTPTNQNLTTHPIIQLSHPTHPPTQQTTQLNRSRGRRWQEATAATRSGGCSDDGDGDEGRAATTATGSGGFPPSSSTLTTATPSSSSATLRVAVVAATTATRRAAEELEGVAVVRVEEDGGNPPDPVAVVAAPFRSRRCRRFLPPSSSSAPVEVGGLLSWRVSWMAELVELDELDEVSSFDWLGCNTQHVSSTRVEEMPFRAWLKATVSNQRMNQRFDFPIRLHSGQFEGMRQWKEGSGDRTARRTAGSVGQQIKDVSGEDSYEKCMDRNNKGDNDRNDYS